MGNSANKTTPLPTTTPLPYYPERRPSVIDMLIEAAQESPPPTHSVVSRQFSTTLNYATRFDTPAKRVKHAYKRFVKEVFKKHSSKDSTDAFDDDTIDQFMEDQQELGLTESECRMLFCKIAAAHIIEKKEEDNWKIMGTSFKMFMGYFDMGTDLATLHMYIFINPRIALVQGIVLAFSFAVQCVSSVALGQPWWVGLVGLMGMKPMLEWWREVFEELPFVGQLMGNDLMLWLSRMVEMSKLLEVFPHVVWSYLTPQHPTPSFVCCSD